MDNGCSPKAGPPRTALAKCSSTPHRSLPTARHGAREGMRLQRTSEQPATNGAASVSSDAMFRHPRARIIRAVARIAAVTVVLLVGAAAASSARQPYIANQFKARVGAYTLAFAPKSGTIVVSHGGSAALQIKELGGNAKVNLLKSTKKITHSGANW